MSDNEHWKPLEFPHSPVPFVVIAPAARGEQLIARGGNADITLVGFASKPLMRIGRQPKSFPGMLAALFRDKSRPLPQHAVSSETLPILPNDTRGGMCVLAWQGIASPSEESEIREDFSRRCLDLVEALDKRDAGRVEMILAPTISLCHSATEKFLTRERFMKAYLATMITGTLIPVLYVILRNLFR